MPTEIDAATAQFLHVAMEDLQQQLKTAGEVSRITIAEAPAGVWLTAALLIGTRAIEVSGYGEDLVAAYADLRVRVAEPTLVIAYREQVGS